MNYRSFCDSAKKIKKPYFLYGAIFFGFMLWMGFLDTHSWTILSELNQEIDQLEKEKKVLREIIEKDQKTINALKNKDSLERFAREKYGHKKNNETVFIIESQDSLN